MGKEDFYRIIKQIHDKYGYINRSLLEDNITTFNVSWQLSKYNGLKNICKELGLKYIQKSKLKVVYRIMLDVWQRVLSKMVKESENQ